MSEQTIQTQEVTATCRLRRSFVPKVFGALNRVAPVTDAEAKVILESAGLTRAMTDYIRSDQFKTDAAYGEVVAASKTPREAEARDRFEDIMEELGPEPVLHALAGLALAAGMKPPAWVVHSPARVEENRVVTEYSPVRPPPKAPKRRTG